MRKRRHFAHATTNGNGPATAPPPAPPPPPKTPPGDLIPLVEACKLLPGARPGKRLHVATLTRWILTGKIDGWKVGCRLYVSRAHVLLLMQPIPVTAASGGRSPAEWIREHAANDKTLREHGLL